MDRCRLCSHSEMTTILSGLGKGRGNEYSLCKCNKCSFVSLKPLPDANTLKALYAGEYWQGDSESDHKLMDLLFFLRMRGILSELRGLLPPKGRILDWGCGDGALVRLLAREGFAAYGIDLYSTRVDGKTTLTASIKTAPFEKESFDCITSFHVIEHLEDPVGSVNAAFNLLKPGGIMVAEVPNLASFHYELFLKRWNSLDIPAHINHFTPTTFSMLFTKIGKFEIIRTAFFSQRFSAAGFLNSLFPFLSPREVRQRNESRYPTPLKVLYLLFQVALYPVVLIEAWCKRGGIIRVYGRKKGIEM